jgi:hypothetical protein
MVTSMHSGKKWAGFASFVLVVLVAGWVVGPIALWVVWFMAVAILVGAAVYAPARRARWILISAVVLLVILPVAVIVDLAAGQTTVHLFG